MNLNNYLNNKDEQLMKIIEYLTFTKSKITVPEIQNLLNCSNRSVYNYIDELNQKFDNKISFKFENNLLEALDISYSSYEYARYLLFKESKMIALIQDIFLHPKRSIREYSSINKISTSYTYKIVKKLERLLVEDEIILNPNPLYFSSINELNVRIFISNIYYINKEYQNCEYYKRISSSLEYKLMITPELQAISINEPFKEYLLIFLYVSYIRDFQEEIPNLYTEKNIDKKPDLNDIDKSSSINMIIRLVRKEIMFSLERSKRTVSLFKKKLMNSESIEATIESEETLMKLYLYLGITQHIKIEKLSISQRFLLSYDNLSNTNPCFANEMMDILVSLFKEEYSLESDEPRMKLLITLLAMRSPEMITSGSKNILVISDLSRVHARKICDLIRAAFSEHIYSYYSLNEIIEKPDNYTHVDYVISTASLRLFPKEKIILINDLVTSRDLAKIHDAIYKY